MGQMTRVVEPYRPYHSVLMDQNEHGPQAYHHNPDPKTTFCGVVDNDNVICMAGIVPIWDGVGHAWVRFSPDSSKHKIWLFKKIIIHMNHLVRTHGFWRIQATVARKHHSGCDWIEAIGFDMESILEKYGPFQEDHFMYRKLYE